MKYLFNKSISNKAAVMAEADVHICLDATDIDTWRGKLVIFSCSSNFYLMEILRKVFC